MKKLSFTAVALVILAVFSILAVARSAFAWSQSVHAYVATECLDLDNKFIASYNAKMGSIVPDFFWHLRDRGWISDETAYLLHGPTEDGCEDDTTYFYRVASSLLKPWNYRLKFFAKGIKTHVLADIKAHNELDGYIVEWIPILAEKMAGDPMAEYTEELHLSLELAVDSLLVYFEGLRLNSLLISYTQANFLEKAVIKAFNNPRLPPPREGLDVSLEFKKYLSLMRVLEKAAALYAPCLIQGKVDEKLLNVLESSEFLDAERELSDQALGLYFRVLAILVHYPEEIYQTLTGDGGGANWMNALDDVIDFCSDFDNCP